jgi:hypothetical protein
MDKEISTEDMTMKMLASRLSSCVTSWQAYDINGYTYYTKEKDKKSVTYRTYGTLIAAIDPQGLKPHTMTLRIRIPVFRCQWVKHPNGVNLDNYGLTLVDLKNVGHQDDPWVLADYLAHVFYVLNLETGKHTIIFGK